MQNKLRYHAIAAVFATWGLVGSAFGYAVRTDDSGVYILKWGSSSVTIQNKLSATADLLDGNSQRSSVDTAMQFWNAQLGTVQLFSQASTGSYALGNGASEIAMDSAAGGEAFDTNTLAVTIMYRRGNNLAEGDIIFNSAYTWNSYRGSLRSGQQEIQRVAIHELGHVLGLLHPDEEGQTVSAIMNSHVSSLDNLTADDISGGQKLYGAPGFVPTNNNFAAATLVVEGSGPVAFTGSNIAASREPGEPSHAGAPVGHSVWWKWRAPSDGTLALDTFGSNFDTSLSVYTGSQLSNLTSVVFNDDAETTAQNSTPTRKRTSSVTTLVTGGTTYYFAVDGWPDSSGISQGYTGSIVLNLSFTPTNPPVGPPPTARLANIAARGYCSTGARVMIGGFVIGGSTAKRVLVRAIGPSLVARGLNAADVLADPIIEVHKGEPIIATNDNWGDNSNLSEMNTVAAQIGAGALDASDTKSAALLLNLQPGAYTFVARGTNDTSGIVLLEVFDADPNSSGAQLVNIATRAYSKPGDGVTIGGFVISGNARKQVLLRAVGPTLLNFGIASADLLANPTIELHDASHGNVIIGTNDNWSDNSNAASITSVGSRIGASPFDSADTKSSALLLNLDPGAYTFIASGNSNTSGIVLVEIYNAD